MSQYDTQVPDLTNKYRKYLGKFEDALVRQDQSKLDLYSKKIRMYGMLLQSGGTLDEHLQNIIVEVQKSLNDLKGKTNVSGITAQVNELRTRFNELTNQYRKNMSDFIELGNNTREQISQISSTGTIAGLSELLAGNVDDIIQVPIFMNAIQDGDFTDPLIPDTIRRINILKTFPGTDFDRIIGYLRTGNDEFEVPQNVDLADRLVGLVREST